MGGISRKGTEGAKKGGGMEGLDAVGQGECGNALATGKEGIGLPGRFESWRLFKI